MTWTAEEATEEGGGKPVMGGAKSSVLAVSWYRSTPSSLHEFIN